MPDKFNPNAETPSRQNTTPDSTGKRPQEKRPPIDKALENEIGSEVEHGQLSSDELNSGNDI